MYIAFAVGFICGMMLIGAIWAIYIKRMHRFSGYLSAALQALADGKYETRVFEERAGHFIQTLSEHFNGMAKGVEEEIQTLSQERDILQHILQNMSTGVIYIGRNGQIQMVNEVAERLFKRPPEQWTNREHWTIFRNYNLGAAIDNALLFGNPWESELCLRETQMIAVRIVPIHTSVRSVHRTEQVYDVLMLCNDVSEFRRLERMRSEFVANVSHELKTPIASIRGFAETLLDDDVDNEHCKRFLQTIYDESNRMNHLVSDLLELSKLEADEHRLHPISVNLAQIVERAFERLHALAEARQIKMKSAVHGSIQVWADEEMLLQVLSNLLVNAIHYSSDQSCIDVTCEILVDRVKVHVLDQGIGIPAEHLERLFERFYRVHRDRSRASGGTGLGLSIVKHIITSFGGEVGVNSEPGVGSDFWFTLSRLEDSLPHPKLLSFH